MPAVKSPLHCKARARHRPGQSNRRQRTGDASLPEKNALPHLANFVENSLNCCTYGGNAERQPRQHGRGAFRGQWPHPAERNAIPSPQPSLHAQPTRPKGFFSHTESAPGDAASSSAGMPRTPPGAFCGPALPDASCCQQSPCQLRRAICRRGKSPYANCPRSGNPHAGGENPPQWAALHCDGCALRRSVVTCRDRILTCRNAPRHPQQCARDIPARWLADRTTPAQPRAGTDAHPPTSGQSSRHGAPVPTTRCHAYATRPLTGYANAESPSELPRP
jgi:hypothetical protein